MILDLISEAARRGAAREKACAILGLDVRTVQRWRDRSEDRRRGPKHAPANALSPAERQQILIEVNRPEHRDLPPSQIVPRLADEGRYIGSESTIYRVLREERQLEHRGRSKPRTNRRPTPLIATGPNQVWSWDITYLKTDVRGLFFYLYLVVDVFSRKVVGFDVHDRESPELAALLVRRACKDEGVEPGQLVVHMDNGGPMKGATFHATLLALGVASSFSRPSVSDDNPFSESLWRTMKYRPEYPELPFVSLEQARQWTARFVRWYNEVHRHSGIRFVTPAQRHEGADVAVLSKRGHVYERARAAHPERWTGECRNWSRIESVELNPARNTRGDQTEEVAA